MICLRYSTAIFATLSASVASYAAVTFSDDFSTNQGPVSVYAGGFGHSDKVSVAPGTTRSFTIYQERNDAPGIARSNASVTAGAFSLSNDAAASATGSLRYEFSQTQDLTGVPGFRLSFLYNDTFVIANLNLVDDKGGSSLDTVLLHSSFGGYDSAVRIKDTTHIDLSRVKLIQFSFAGVRGSDMILDSITPVPEPAPMAALGVGALVMLRRRRRA